jgi:hypothetical protein
MKKICKFLLVIVGLNAFYMANAQVKTEVKEDAKKAGNKTAEVAAKAKAKVADKEYKDKTGPNGETVYIDGHDKFYWIDKKGHKRYAKKSQLKDK